MRSLLLVAAALAALVAGGWYVVEWMPHEGVAAASVTATPAQVHPQQIRSIRLDGDRLPLTILGATLSAKVGDTLDQATLDADRQTLRDTLIGRGFWAAEVGAPEITFGGDGGAYVAYRIDPGAVFHVRSVTVAPPSVRGADGALDAAVTLSPGDDVSPQRLSRNAELITSYLARHGHPGAQVSIETTTDRDARAVDVKFVVRAAPRS